MDIDPSEEILKVCLKHEAHEKDYARFVNDKTLTNAELKYKEVLLKTIERLRSEGVPATLIRIMAECECRVEKAEWRHEEIVLTSKKDIISSMQSRKKGYENINKIIG